GRRFHATLVLRPRGRPIGLVRPIWSCDRSPDSRKVARRGQRHPRGGIPAPSRSTEGGSVLEETRRRARGARRGRKAAVLAAVGAVGTLAVAAPYAVSAASGPATHVYVVQLAEKPAAGYTGGIAGYPATRPAHGAKLHAKSTTVQRYRGYLKSRHASVAARIP